MFSKLRIMKLTIPASYITTGTRLKHRHIVAVVANVLSSSVRQAREIISSQFIHVDSNSVNTLSRPDIKERGLSLLVKPQPGYLGCAVRRYWRPSTRLPRSAAQRSGCRPAAVPAVTRAATATRWTNGLTPPSHSESRRYGGIWER